MPETIEVEAKFRVSDLKKVTEMLMATGAKLNWTDTITDYNFTLKQRDFWATIEGLRVRLKASRKGGTLTYKPSGNKTQDTLAVKEYETNVENPEQLMKIFSYLDVIPLPGLPHVKKTRHDYTCGEFSIILDEYPLIGSFIEIEKIVNAESEVEEAKKRIDKFALELGLFEKDRQKIAAGFLLKEEYLKSDEHE